MPYWALLLIPNKPLTPMRDQDWISPYNINTSDENKEIYQLGDYKVIQYQIPQTNITRTV